MGDNCIDGPRCCSCIRLGLADELVVIRRLLALRTGDDGGELMVIMRSPSDIGSGL